MCCAHTASGDEQQWYRMLFKASNEIHEVEEEGIPWPKYE